MFAPSHDTARGNIFRFPQDAPVSSRGQDTWLSATGPVRKRFAMAVSSNG